MPIVFEQIDTEIAPERGADTQSRGGTDSQGSAANPAELADALRRELKLFEERGARLQAD